MPIPSGSMTSAPGRAAELDVPALNAELDEMEEGIGSDIEAATARAGRLIEASTALGCAEAYWRAVLLRADLTERQGDLAGAAAAVQEARRWAAEQGSRRLLSRAHRLLGRIARNTGDLAGSLDHMLKCVAAFSADTPPSERISALIGLADSFADIGSMPAARDQFERAYRTATELGLLERQLTALNNYAYSEYEAGEPHRAHEVLQRLQALAARHGRPLDAAELDTIARVHLDLGNLLEAEAAADEAVARFAQDGMMEADSQASYMLTSGMVRHRRGDLESAQLALNESEALCREHGLGLLLAEVMGEQAALYATLGQFEKAYHRQCEAQAAERRQSSADREAQIRHAQVLYEVADVRQQAESFRDEARRDALTGLRNRRFIDERLPELLIRQVPAGSPLVVALLDLDHFKRINDTFSHQAGDAVLSTVAGLLVQVPLGATGFAARLGGEEFLLVLTDSSVPEAIMKLEDLRQRVAAHDWTAVTGDVPVTISIGVTAATAGSTVVGLLAHADSALYGAKAAGRNRVHVEENLDITERRNRRIPLAPTGDPA
jgi:two-component system cell cycle response regulator